MEDNILDYFPENERDSKSGEIIIIKFFYFETPARLYAARLKEADIPSFVSNSNVNIPFGNGSISLHVRKTDQEKAAHIIHQLDKRNLPNDEAQEEESFHDADHSDIAYQKALNEDSKYLTPIVVFAVVVIIFLIAQFVLNNPEGGWR